MAWEVVDWICVSPDRDDWWAVVQTRLNIPGWLVNP